MSRLDKIKHFLHWQRSPKPDIIPPIYPHLKAFRLPLIMVQIIMIAGTMGYYLIDDFPLLDAIYQTGITFTTVGFGEIHEISPAGKIFYNYINYYGIYLIYICYCNFSRGCK